MRLLKQARHEIGNCSIAAIQRQHYSAHEPTAEFAAAIKASTSEINAVARELIKRRFKAFRVGPLPADAINAALGTELESADVWVSKAAHQHMALDHPDDYPAVIANIVELIRSPTWVGQDPKHGENFYLVGRVKGPEQKDAVLISIGLERNEHGTYNVRTGYAISEDDILTRRLRGSLHALYMK